MQMDISILNKRRIEYCHLHALYKWCIENSTAFSKISNKKFDEKINGIEWACFSYWYCGYSYEYLGKEHGMYLIRYITRNTGRVIFMGTVADCPENAIAKMINKDGTINRNRFAFIDEDAKRYCKKLNNFLRLQKKKGAKNEQPKIHATIQSD